MTETSHSPVSQAYVTFKGRCPACGKGKLYKSLLNITDTCSHCGLNLASREVGDGPAFLAILLVGALTAISATITDMKFALPLWVHAIVWIPFVFITSILSLRWIKAWMIAVQFQYRKDDFKQP